MFDSKEIAKKALIRADEIRNFGGAEDIVFLGEPEKIECDIIGSLFKQALKKEAREFAKKVDMQSFWERFEYKLDMKKALIKARKRHYAMLTGNMIAIVACGFLIFFAGVTLTYLWINGSPSASYNEYQSAAQLEYSGYIIIENPAVPLSPRIRQDSEFSLRIFILPAMIIVGIIAGFTIYHVLFLARRKRVARRVVKKIGELIILSPPLKTTDDYAHKFKFTKN